MNLDEAVKSKSIKVKLTMSGYTMYWRVYDVSESQFKAIVDGFMALFSINKIEMSLESYLRLYDITFREVEPDVTLELEY